MPYKLTGISGSLWRFPWGVRCPLVLGHGTPLPSRGGKGVSSLLSSWGRDQGLFLVVPWGSQALLRLMTWCSGWHSSRCRGMRPYLQWTGTSGSFLTVAWPLEFLSSFKVRPASSWGATGTSGFLCRWSRGMDPYLEMRRGNQDSSWVVAGNSGFLSTGDGYVGELLELPKGCQVPFRGLRGKVGFLSRCCSGEGPHLALRGESPGFLESRQDTWSSSRVATGTSGTRSCCLRKVKSPFELRGAFRDSSPVGAGA